MNHKQAPLPRVPWDHPRFSNWLAVAKVHVLWQRQMAAALAPHGIKLPHYDVLANLIKTPGISQQMLADKIMVGRSNLSMLLPEMEKRGWISREADAEDKRIRRVLLTQEGMRVAHLALGEHVKLLDFMMGDFGEAECNQMGAYMRRIGERLKM